MTHLSNFIGLCFLSSLHEVLLPVLSPVSQVWTWGLFFVILKGFIPWAHITQSELIISTWIFLVQNSSSSSRLAYASFLCIFLTWMILRIFKLNRYQSRILDFYLQVFSTSINSTSTRDSRMMREWATSKHFSAFLIHHISPITKSSQFYPTQCLKYICVSPLPRSPCST